MDFLDLFYEIIIFCELINYQANIFVLSSYCDSHGCTYYYDLNDV